MFLYGFHLFAAVASYVLAYLLRFDFVLPLEEMPRFWRSLPILLVARFAAFLYYRLFQGWWSYTSLKDAELVVRANVMGSLLFVVATSLVYYGEAFPRSVWMIDLMLCTGLLMTARLAARLYRENARSKFKQIEKNVLVIGAGEAGVRLVQEVEANPGMGMHVLGFVDDDPAKKKATVRGVPVLGATDQLPQITRKMSVDEIIISIPSAPSFAQQAIDGPWGGHPDLPPSDQAVIVGHQ